MRRMARSTTEGGRTRHHPGLGRTGGTDGHLHELGGVVTCAEADTAEEFLEAVRRRETVIIGHERPLVEGGDGDRGPPAPPPYTVPILQARWEQSLL